MKAKHFDKKFDDDETDIIDDLDLATARRIHQTAKRLNAEAANRSADHDTSAGTQ